MQQATDNNVCYDFLIRRVAQIYVQLFKDKYQEAEAYATRCLEAYNLSREDIRKFIIKEFERKGILIVSGDQGKSPDPPAA